MNFLEKYEKARKDKKSILSIGLDPATKEIREDNIIPENFLKGKEFGGGILDFCLDIVERTSEHASCVKVNSQYVLFLMSLKQLKNLNEKIHSLGMLSILDHKLGDISDSNLPALFWAKKAGFDALTFSPFAGNIQEATNEAHKKGLGIFILTLMSNSEAVWIQKHSLIEGNPLYKEIAQRIKMANSDGLVVGATNHISEEEIKILRTLVGYEKIFLCPGIGFQGGDLEKLISSAGKNLLINVGRAIIYDKSPERKAQEFNERINEFYR